MNKKIILFIITIGYSLGLSMGAMMEENGYSTLNASDGLKKLSRRKRFLAFPEGSSFAVRIFSTLSFYVTISECFDY